MAYPGRPAEGFDNHSCGGMLPPQQDWPTEIPDLDLSFDLSFGLLNWNDHSVQQNQNVDVALHAIDISGQFPATFPLSHNQGHISTPWPSVQIAPSFGIVQSQALERQGQHPDSFVGTSEVLRPAGASALPFELPDEFQCFQDLRVGKCRPRCEKY